MRFLLHTLNKLPRKFLFLNRHVVRPSVTVSLVCFFAGPECNSDHLDSATEKQEIWDERFQILCRSRLNHALRLSQVGSLSSLVPLMRQGVKVIHLIRDPRATYMSRSVSHIRDGSHIEDIKQYCDDHLNDADTIRNLYARYQHAITKVLYVVRYEDLAMRPSWYIRDMYAFLGVVPDQHILKWVKGIEDKHLAARMKNLNKLPEMTHHAPGKNITGQMTGSYVTGNELPEIKAFGWMKKLNRTLLIDIQRVCGRFFTEYGYNIFRSTDELSRTDSTATSLNTGLLFRNINIVRI